ncbi:hypothetical protein ABIA30_002213 [Mycobacterium sp. MAA66]
MLYLQMLLLFVIGTFPVLIAACGAVVRTVASRRPAIA